MDESWLAVSDAARELGLSPRRVRDLLESGALLGRRVGRSWLIAPQDVQQRTAHSTRPGRPLSANNAWRCLILLDPQEPAHIAAQEPAAGDRLDDLCRRAEVSPMDRSRLRRLLADVPDPDHLVRLVRSRAGIRRVRVHSGVLDRAVTDMVVSVGGGAAVAALGGGVATGGRRRVYVTADEVDDYVGRYRLADDVEGSLDLAVIPSDVDRLLRPEPGAPVPLSVAWADLLDDPDSRARSAAREWVRSRPRPLAAVDGRHG